MDGNQRIDHWEVVTGYPFDNSEAAFQRYYLGVPTKIVAHFEERLSAVYIPTSFTPNEDGVNDIFRVNALNIDPDDFRLSVVNRWGREIFYTENPEDGWNGSDNGDDYYAPPGNYVYFVRYVNTVTDRSFYF